MPNETAQENEITAAAGQIAKDIDPFARIDAYMIIDLREQLMAETGCTWESAQRHIWTALGAEPFITKRPDRIVPAENPESETSWSPTSIAVAGTSDEVKAVRRMIPDTRKRLMILMEWIKGQDEAQP